MTVKFDLEDMRYFADRHRGKYKNSGPHWSLVNRFPVLFDELEAVKAELENANKKLDAASNLLESISVWFWKKTAPDPIWTDEFKSVCQFFEPDNGADVMENWTTEDHILANSAAAIDSTQE